MLYTKPEECGIKSRHITNFVKNLMEEKLCVHDFLIMRHGKVIAEHYIKPFDEKFRHRQYSCSKSFVAVAIGLLYDDGLISLEDKVVEFFPEYVSENTHPYIKDITIRNLLTMSTPFSGTTYSRDRDDWVRSFFTTEPSHPAGTVFSYDTSASFILDVIVEKIAKKPFTDFLYERIFRYMDGDSGIKCVKSPDGYSWGGSGVLCTLHDFANLGLLLLNKGRYNGKQLLSEEYVQMATSKQIDNNTSGHHSYNTNGYGFQIWMTRDNSFSLIGMGAQLVICVPDKDMLLAINCDLQGNSVSYKQIYDAFFNEIVPLASDAPLPEDEKEYALLVSELEAMHFPCLDGAGSSPLINEINGAEYRLSANPMNIESLSFKFEGRTGTFCYTNKTGYKEIRFGLGHYEFGEFGETHYFGDTIRKPLGRGYKYMCTGAFTEENKLVLRLYIIDDYFGNATFTFGFKGNEIGVLMLKTAEWFLDEYQGFAGGVKN